MLLVCMKCVNCSIVFLILSMLSCSMFMLCFLVCVLLLGGGGRGRAGGGVSFILVFCMLGVLVE